MKIKQHFVRVALVQILATAGVGQWDFLPFSSSIGRMEHLREKSPSDWATTVGVFFKRKISSESSENPQLLQLSSDKQVRKF